VTYVRLPLRGWTAQDRKGAGRHLRGPLDLSPGRRSDPAPGFLVVAYLPAIMHASGPLTVVAVPGYGVGQVTGTALVPRLIRRQSEEPQPTRGWGSSRR
jgi:hypothetical protein